MKTLEGMILERLISEGGEARSLLRISTHLGIGYNHSWFALQNLENQGLVIVERKKGLPLIMRLSKKECQGTGSRPAPEAVSSKYPGGRFAKI